MTNYGLDSNIVSTDSARSPRDNQWWSSTRGTRQVNSGGVFAGGYCKMNTASQTLVTLNDLSLSNGHFVSYGKPYLARDYFDRELIYKAIKRIIDALVAGIALIVAIPFMAIIAMLIKLDSRGPALFKQVRIGRDRRVVNGGNGHLSERRKFNLGGRPFTIFKFRTMRVDVDSYSFKPKQTDDERLTKVGRVVRRLCLDELPQMWNILKGDMSLVGPRPELPNIVQKYGIREAARLAVKPGLTGLWQLYAPRNQMIHENLQYDLEYLRNRSLSFDLKILLRTIPFVFGLQNV